MRIDAQDIKGKKFSLNLKEFQARIFQHEYDHLEVSKKYGIFMIRRSFSCYLM